MTGLAYVRHRDYSASLGRFIELDPIGFNAGDNNWYRFVANGPTGKTDPSGLYEIDDDFMGIPMDEWFPIPPSPQPRSPRPGDRDEHGLPMSGPLRPGDFGANAGGSVCDTLLDAKRDIKDFCKQVAIDTGVHLATGGIPIRGLRGARNGAVPKVGLPIQFGKNANQVNHALRHLKGRVDMTKAITAITDDLNAAASELNAGLNIRKVIVDDVELTYNAFKLPNGLINVGRITIPQI
jgi:uncharacterized protein RhaS with RHS repeats